MVPVAADDRSGPATRRDEYLKGARTLLENWRYNTWMETYSHVPYGPEGLLPDLIINKIAYSTRLRSVEDLIGIGWSPSRAQRHGLEVVGMLEEYDRKHQRTRAAEQAQKAEAKRLATEQKKA
ncbi:hypothetical protein BV22DRAFT_1026823, partial [Leucogyrophana mollusca]